ncbi:MAG: hypothetical protein KBS51_00890 [Lachnospiraceae bacterium]|nr:hypothetical protein [Candidatus Darwinimomas equi]
MSDAGNTINDNLQQQAQAIWLSMFSMLPRESTVADVALNVTDGVHNTVVDDPNGDCYLLSCKNIKGGHLTIGASERRISRATFDKLRKRTKLSKGDILLSSVGTVGELLLLNDDPNNYEFQRSVAMIKPNPKIVSSAYLYEALLAQNAEIINAAHGAVQQCIFISDMAGFKVAVPDFELIAQYDTLAQPMLDAIRQNKLENQRLSLLRDTLLPKFMSGEIDVSVI